MAELRRRRTDNELDDLEASFRYCPRYDTPHPLTDEQIEVIIEKALEKARKDIYQGVGQTAVRWAFYVVGIVVVGFASIAIQKGWLKP